MGDFALNSLLVHPVGEFYFALTGTAFESMNVGSLVILDPTAATWKKANAGSAAGVKGVIGIVISGAQGTHHIDGTLAVGEQISVLTMGYVELATTLTIGKQLYASATAGLMTDVAPAQFRALGAPITSTVLFFNPVSTEPAS